MGKSKFNYEYLPYGVVKVIRQITREEREYRTQNNYLLVAGLIFHHQMSDVSSYYDYKPLAREYWRSVVGSHYSKYINQFGCGRSCTA